LKFYVKHSDSQYWYCDSPEVALIATRPGDVAQVLAEVERLQHSGYLVAGWIAYEAATAFDHHLAVNEDAKDESPFPLIAMLATKDFELTKLPALAHGPLQLQPRIRQQDYENGFAQLHELILQGDLYQANYSFRADVTGLDDGLSLFSELERHHPMPYSAYIEYDGLEVVSLSPELFLQREGDIIRSEPMKGTAARGKSYADDLAQSDWLRNDVKNRAENVMIVDLMRNDLSRVCKPQSVQTPELFTTKRFRSLHQMVSRVQGELMANVSLTEILAATFPAGSITGTPKIRAMEVIQALESDPRKAYTGSVGVFLPGGDFQLNVAIRTLVVDKRSGSKTQAELGIGSGVVSHSADQAEWSECLLKGEFLNYRTQHSEIFETLLWQDGYHYLEEHIERLLCSCEYFSVAADAADLRAKLMSAAPHFSGPTRVRIAVTNQGAVTLSTTALKEAGWGSGALKVLLESEPVDANELYQYHKTNNRAQYDAGFKSAQAQGFDEALYFNTSNQLAEGAISNVFLLIAGRWLTPHLDAGILPGIWRQQMIQDLSAIEQPISQALLLQSERILIGNSVRGTGEVHALYSSQGRKIWSKDDSNSRELTG
jgi:para-aminobenzoate synthetase/4-amino-4-deoxychorismate lyase